MSRNNTSDASEDCQREVDEGVQESIQKKRLAKMRWDMQRDEESIR